MTYHSERNQTRAWRALIPLGRRISLFCITLGFSWAMLTLLWVGMAQAQPPSRLQSALYTEYGVPSARPTSAHALAAALDIAAQDLISAAVLSNDLDTAFAVFGRVPGTWFPTRHDTFLWMSTGDALATTFLTPTDFIHLDTHATMLYLSLHVPLGKTCANFDFAFYTRTKHPVDPDAPSDYFIAQPHAPPPIAADGTLAWPLHVPGNFALGRNNETVTAQSVYASPAVAEPPATDGVVSPLLRARVAVTPNTQVELYLTLGDVVGNGGHSAVAIDNFHWKADPDCVTGASGDRDGDGLPDAWERYGITLTSGTADAPLHDYVNLPLMGANPDISDVFVEIDHMRLEHPLTEEMIFDYSPNAQAISIVVQAFANAPVTNVDGSTGIHLHVDYGEDVQLQWPSTTPAPTGVWTWGSLDPSTSRLLGNGGPIPFAQNVIICPNGDTQDWTGVDQLKAANKLLKARALVFHYGVWGHQLCEHKSTISGISRNWPQELGKTDYFAWGASDFIVILGPMPRNTLIRTRHEAGTFMHELGHNLGLMHGGSDYVKYKPNHLSVMNYHFQMSGLMRDGEFGYFDYDRFAAPTLTTTHLAESMGVYSLGQRIPAHLGTKIYCPAIADTRTITAAWEGIDWNCNGIFESGTVSATIVEPCSDIDCNVQVLTTTHEWERLAFTGGLLRRDFNILAPVKTLGVIPYIWLLPSSPDEPEPPEPDLPRVELLPSYTNHDELEYHD